MRKLSYLLGVIAILGFAVLSVATSANAQTSSASTVTGTVFDKSGATVPDAEVVLEDADAGGTTTVATGNDGIFTFPAIRPGNYNLRVSAKGFRKAVVNSVKVEVGKSVLLRVMLELGQVSETVEVTAGTGIELQTLNASVGNVLDASVLANMPSLSRDATSLMLLQPMASPGFNGAPGTTYGEGNASGGGVAGMRADQNTFMIDGGDATSNMEGAGGYNTGFVATPRAVVPTPVESLEEFRVETNNAGVEFNRSVGAEVQMVTKRGSNDWHGAGYWYHQNDEANANDWFRNTLKVGNPEWRDNRYGGRVGGPIWKNRTFFFLHEEERHFFTQSVFQRLIPSDALRVGILKFRDAGGIVRAYNLNPTPTLDVKACAAPCNDNDPLIGTMLPGDNGTLDPRMIGLSPAIAATWALMPEANDFSSGDAALRAPKLTSSVPNTTNEHDAVLRIDHKINDKIDFMTSYRFSKASVVPANKQEDIGGIAPGCQKGLPCSLADRPLQPRYWVTGVTARITPNLVNEFHFDWLRHWWSWIAPGAGIQTIDPGLSDTRLQIWSESRINGMVPINVDTQNARQRVWNGQDYTFSDNLSWIHGKHAWVFGGRAQIQHFLHVRDDKVVGGLTTPLYYTARGGQFTNIGGVPIPAGVKSSDVATFKTAYISALGLVDSATQVLTRSGDLTAQKAGSTITQKENVNSYDLYFGDTWRPTSSLTFSYGLNWDIQMPPFDPTGKTAMMVDASSRQVIDSATYLNSKRLAALNGDIFNPVVGYVPIAATGRKYPFDPDYSNFGPRLGVAWNPGGDGPLGFLLGNKKTVVRGGWSRQFERKNGVGLVLTPALGVGFGDLADCIAPGSGKPDPSAGGAVAPLGCNNGGTPSSNFRIGVDGNHINIPQLPPVSGGLIIPGVNSIFEGRDSRLDPHYKTGSSDSFDLTIQRELPGKMIMEIGYVGRKSRDLFGNIDLNAIPYMFTPKGVNQTFAQAFDKVAAQLQQGVKLANLTPQPWFESVVGPGGTVAAAKIDGGSAWAAHGAGAVWFELEAAGAIPADTIANTQVGAIDWSGNFTYGNYNAGFITLRSRGYHGVTFDMNYTYSHSLDNFGITQECTSVIPDAYDPHRSYAPSIYDRRHTFNMLVNYDLPFGKGTGRFASGAADRVFGGWSVSGIYTIASGLPDFVYDSAACFSEFGTTPSNGVPVGLIPIGSGNFSQSRHDTAGGINMFSDPNAVAAAFRYPTFDDKTLGWGRVRDPRRWNFDFSIAKRTRITERISTRFDAQFVNAFNHPQFGSGDSSFFQNAAGMDLSTPGAFGVPSNQFNSPRYIQFGLRFDF
jgi:hypothetical protein